MELYLHKYLKATGKVIGPNYYKSIPEDAEYGYTEVLPTQNFINMHFDEGTGEYYEGATQEEIEQYTIENAVSVVSRRQLKLALRLSGFDLSIIDNVIDNLTGLEKIGEAEGSGTKVHFKPDHEIFEETEYDFEILSQRLLEIITVFSRPCSISLSTCPPEVK